jgi:ceramide glucosyltransferase
MVAIAHLAGAFAVIAFLAHVATTLIAIRRLRVLRTRVLPLADRPPVTIVKPVCGLDAGEAQTLRSPFKLDPYPRHSARMTSMTPTPRHRLYS